MKNCFCCIKNERDTQIISTSDESTLSFFLLGRLQREKLSQINIKHCFLSKPKCVILTYVDLKIFPVLKQVQGSIVERLSLLRGRLGELTGVHLNIYRFRWVRIKSTGTQMHFNIRVVFLFICVYTCRDRVIGYTLVVAFGKSKLILLRIRIWGHH